MAVINDELIKEGIAVVLGGGFFSAIVALLKTPVQTGRIALDIQDGVLENLNNEIARANDRISVAEKREERLVDENTTLRNRVNELVAECFRLKEQIIMLIRERDDLRERQNRPPGERRSSDSTIPPVN